MLYKIETRWLHIEQALSRYPKRGEWGKVRGESSVRVVPIMDSMFVVTVYRDGVFDRLTMSGSSKRM